MKKRTPIEIPPGSLQVKTTHQTRRLFDKAHDQWGRDPVLIQAMEECGEFIQATAKLLNNKKRDPDNFIEESADAIICIINAAYEVHSLDELSQWIDRKLTKLERKLVVPDGQGIAPRQD